MEDAVRVLRGDGGGKTPGGVGVDTDLARQEFISGGQQVSSQDVRQCSDTTLVC
jgi:hypothetical protein